MELDSTPRAPGLVTREGGRLCRTQVLVLKRPPATHVKREEKKFERRSSKRARAAVRRPGQKRCVRSLSQPYSAQISRQMGLQASSCGCRAPVSVDDGERIRIEAQERGLLRYVITFGLALSP